VDDRPRSQHWPASPPLPAGADPTGTVFRGVVGPFERGVGPKLAGSSFRLTAEITVGAEPAEGVLYALGGRHGGYCWYLRDGELRLEVAQSSVQTQTVAAPARLEPGSHRLEVTVIADAALRGRATFVVDGEETASAPLDALLKRVPIGSGRTSIGWTGSSTVSGRVSAPDPFTGRIASVSVVTGDSLYPLAQELQAELRDQ
jgi:arylsulfatase